MSVPSKRLSDAASGDTSAPLESMAFRMFPEAAVIVDESGTLLAVNDQVRRLLGWTSNELVGRPLTELIPDRLRAAHLAGFNAMVHGRRQLADGNVVRVAALSKAGAEIVVNLRIAELERLGEKRVFVGGLHESGAEMLLLLDQQAVNQHLQATARIATMLGKHNVSLAEAGQPALSLLCDSLRWDGAILWVIDPATDHLTPHTCSASDSETFARLFEASSELALRCGEGLPGRCWLNGKPLWIEEIGSETASSEAGISLLPRIAVAQEIGVHGWLAIPLASGSQIRGVVELLRLNAGPVEPDMLETLSTVGQVFGHYLERLRVETELRASRKRFANLARTLQKSLLPPKLPRLAWMDVAAVYRPGSGESQVGGDFYDLFATRGQAWYLTIGDVCGRGVPAATLASLARHTIRAAAMEAHGPSSVLSTLNSVVEAESEPDAFLTVVCARLQPVEQGIRVELSLAGHPQPLLLHNDGTVRAVGKPGRLVGLFSRVHSSDSSFTLKAGECLVFFTDGVTETRGPDGFFGDILADVIAGDASSAAELAGRIERAVSEFGRGGERDDMAIVVIRATDTPLSPNQP